MYESYCMKKNIKITDSMIFFCFVLRNVKKKIKFLSIVKTRILNKEKIEIIKLKEFNFSFNLILFYQLLNKKSKAEKKKKI